MPRARALQCGAAMKRILPLTLTVGLSGCSLLGIGSGGSAPTPAEASSTTGPSGDPTVDTTTPNAAGVVAKRPDDACVSSFDQSVGDVENMRRFGRAAAYRCKETVDENAIKNWLVIEALQGGRKSVPQLGLATIYLSAMTTDGEPRLDSQMLGYHQRTYGKLGKLLDDALVDAQLAGREPSEIAYVHQVVQKAIAAFKVVNAKSPVQDDEVAAWFDAWDKDPELYKLAFALRKQVTDPPGPAWTTWKFEPIASCKRIREKVFEVAPLDQPMNSNELAKRFNTTSGLGLLELASACGYLQGDAGEGDAFRAISEEARTTARYGSKADFPSGDASTATFLAPFGENNVFDMPAYKDLERSACWGHGFGLAGAALLEHDLSIGWGEVASRKDTPDGVLVTFKKAVWSQEKIECSQDGGAPSWNGIAWEPSRSCSVVGHEQAEHQEQPTLVPLDAAKEIKPGRMMSVLNTSSGLVGEHSCGSAEPTVQRRGIPLFVHKNGGTTFKKDDQVQMFFWPVKREAAPKK